ncbi:PAS domain S-box protein [Atopomonas sediminilitoris]|uniref:PAS domain S-box protein n=1 Tax=Atopomonas sediminilitoris TaxID=2919919 RepID=UPI001F4F0A17|nr:PAS domain S-box protein [Atopomonas sediminilitoris]MCJ8169013.1 PAS domain S-box protein [Atopomonas sediminilitoris]
MSDAFGEDSAASSMREVLGQLQDSHQQLQRQLQLSALITRVQSRFIREQDADELFGGLLTDILTITASEYGFIGEIKHRDDGSPYLRTYALSNIAWDQATRDFYDANAPQGLEFSNLKTLFGHTIATGEVVISNEPAADPRSGGLPPGHPALNAYLGLPLKCGDMLVGMVGLANRSSGYDEPLVIFLTPLVTTVAHVVEGFRAARLRDQFQAQLAQSEAFNRSVLNTVVDGIVTINPQGMIESFNQAAERIFGYSNAEVFGRNISMLMPEPYRSAHDGYLLRYLTTGQSHIIDVGREVLGQRKDGSTFALELAVSEVKVGQQHFFTGVVRDLTQKKQAQQQLQQRDEYWRKLTRRIPGVVYQFQRKPDGEQRIVYVSEGVERLLGVSSERVQGNLEHFMALVHPDDVAAYAESVEQSVLTQSDWHHEFRVCLEHLGTRRLRGDSTLEQLPDGTLNWFGFLTDVTEHYQDQLALAQSDARWKFALTGSGDGVWDWDLQTGNVFFSPQWKAMLGYNDAEIGHAWEDFERLLHPDDRDACFASLDEHLQEQSPVFEHEIRLLAKSGQYRWVLDRGMVVARDADGQPLRVIGTHTDIHARKANEEAIRHVNAQLSNLIDSATLVSIIATDTQGLITTFNYGSEHLLGYASSEVVGKATPALFHLAEEVAERGAELTAKLGYEVSGFEVFTALPKRAQPEQRRWTYVQRDGTHLAVNLSVSAVRDEHAQITGFIGIATDISQQVLAEQAAQQNMLATEAALAEANRLALIVSRTSNAVVLTNPEGLIEWVNPSFERISGYVLDEVKGQRPGAFLQGPETDQATVTRIREAVEAGCGVREEILNYHKDGTHYWLDLEIMPVRDEYDVITGFMAIESDITASKQAAQALQLAKARTESLLAAIPDLIFELDSDGICLDYRAPDPDELSLPEERFLGLHFSKSLPRAVSKKLEKAIAKARQDGQSRVVAEYSFPDQLGREHDWEMFLAPQRTGGFVVLIHDISERKRIERMKNEFVSTVSHELRTPLTSIRGALGLINGGALGELPEKAGAMLRMALANSERLSLLINDLLDMDKIESGKMDFANRLLAVPDLLSQAVAANQGYAQSCAVEFVLTPGADVPWVEADPDRLMQVLANLLSNAAKFSPPGSHVELGYVVNGDRVRVNVQDYGPGIPESFRGRIFQKFSQADSSDTRKKGGTGLGLMISKAIVERLGGAIGFSSEQDHGSCFYFDLPLAKQSLSNVVADMASDILFCTHDTQAIERLSRLVAEYGYRLHVVAPQALAAEQQLESAALLIVDLAVGADLSDENLRALIAQEANAPVILLGQQGQAEQGDWIASPAVLGWLDRPLASSRVHELLNWLSGNGQTDIKLLYVEDDEDVAKLMHSLCQPFATIINVATLEGARQQLQREHFDVLILDLGLPDGHGSELLDQLGELAQPPAVLLFSAQPPTRETLRQVAGALVKANTSNQALLQSIHRLVKWRRQHYAEDEPVDVSPKE